MWVRFEGVLTWMDWMTQSVSSPMRRFESRNLPYRVTLAMIELKVIVISGKMPGGAPLLGQKRKAVSGGFDGLAVRNALARRRISPRSLV